MLSPDTRRNNVRLVEVSFAIAVLAGCAQSSPDDPDSDSPTPNITIAAEPSCQHPDTELVAKNTNAATAFKYLTENKDFTPEGASAVVGISVYETNANPINIAGPSDSWGGILAWTKAADAGGWSRLETFAEQTEQDPDDLTTQLDFITYDMTQIGYDKELAEIQNATDVDDAAYLFNVTYIKPVHQCNEARAAFGQAVLDSFGIQS